MKRWIMTSLFLILFCSSCAASQNTPITWRSDEDEIVFYLYLSHEASEQLVDLLSNRVGFDTLSEYLVMNTEGKMPFKEGAMIVSALVSHQAEVKATLKKHGVANGNTIEIIGFKENPVKIVKAAFKEMRAPRYLSDFDSQEHPEVVKALLIMVAGNSFVLEVY